MRWLLTLMYLTGLILAGSDGRWFPWANLAGVLLIALLTALIEKFFAREAQPKYCRPSPKGGTR